MATTGLQSCSISTKSLKRDVTIKSLFGISIQELCPLDVNRYVDERRFFSLNTRFRIFCVYKPRFYWTANDHSLKVRDII